MKKKILVFDNYDSFTYNLVHYIEEIIDDKVDVYRNDKIKLSDIEKYDKIVLSPGPGLPEQSGILKDLIRKYSKTKSILGVCLGMQAIAEVFGAKLLNLDEVYHGVATTVDILDKNENIFNEIPQKISVGRYHSWVVSNKNLPSCIKVTCTDDKGEIMALKHEKYDVRGVQFHPESILTEYGKKIIKNWIENNYTLNDTIIQ